VKPEYEFSKGERGKFCHPDAVFSFPLEPEDEKWDALLATEEAQSLLEKLADEALEEHQAGRTKPIVFTDDGQITPE
jgi:hypothetical protein